MKLTGNALSMLLKRYRAVLGKCRTLNWLAGVVLAGGLVLGSVSGALATDPEVWNPAAGTSVTAVNSGDTPTEGQVQNKNYTTTGLVISGPGTVNIINTTPCGSYLSITGGTVNIGTATTTSAVSSTLFGYGGQTFSTSSSDWATIVQNPNTISGGEINITKGVLGSWQPLTAEGKGLNITDGTINFYGAQANNARLWVGAGNNEGTALPSLSIKNATINVGNGTDAQYGTIAMSGGSASFGSGAVINVKAQGSLSIISAVGNSDANIGTSTYAVTWNAAGGNINNAGTMTIGPNVTYNLKSGTIDSSAGGIMLDGTLNVSGGTLKIGGNASINGMNVPSATITAINAPTDGTVGALNISGGTVEHQVAASATQSNTGVLDLTISGGNVKINGGATARTGSGASNWGSVSFGGYNGSNNAEGTVISGGTITVTNASLFGGNLTGLTGDLSSTTAKLTIKGSANITLVSGGGATTGAINATTAAQTAGILHGHKVLDITGGSITVAQGNFGVLLADTTANSGAINISGGTINVDGTLTMSATPGGRTGTFKDIDAALGDNSAATTANLSGGTLKVGATGTLVINTGLTMNVTSANALSVAQGGTLTNKGTLVADGVTVDLSKFELTAGKAGTYQAGTGTNAGTLAFNDVNFATTTPAQALAGTQLVVNKGMITANTATLAQTNFVKGNAAANKVAFNATNGGTFYASALTLSGLAASNDFNLKAANISIAADQLTLTPATANGDVSLQNINLVVTGKGANSTITGSSTTALGTATLADGGTLTLGDADLAQTAPTGGTINANLTVSGTGAAINVNEGTWTLNSGNTLAVTSGVVTVADGATLDTSGAAATNLSNAIADSTASSGIAVQSGGTLKVSQAQLGGYDTTWTAGSAKKIYVANGGILSVTGYDTTKTGGKQLTLDMMTANTANALATNSAGVIQYDGTLAANAFGDNKIVDGSATTGEISATDTGLVLGNDQAVTTKATMSGTTGAVTVKGGYVAGSLEVEPSSGTTPIATANVTIGDSSAGGTVTLAGNGGQLIEGPTTTNVTLGTTGKASTLNLGIAQNLNTSTGGTATAKGGTLNGDVTFGDADSTLNATSATYTIIGDLGVDNGTDGVVNITNNGKLVVQSETNGVHVASINATDGTLETTAGINTSGNLTADGGTISADGDITIGGTSALGNNSTLSTSGGVLKITSTGTLTGGTIINTATPAAGASRFSARAVSTTQAGNIVLGGVQTATSGENKIISEKGSISMAGSSMTGAAPGTTLVIQAKNGDIESSADIVATTVTAQNITTTSSGDLTAQNVTANKLAVTDLTIPGSGYTSGTLTINGDTADPAVASTVGGAMNLTNTTATINGDLEVTGASTIDGGKLDATDGTTVTYKAASTITGGAQQTYDTLVTENTLGVGDDGDTSSTSVAANKLQLGGALTVEGGTDAPVQMAVGTINNGTDDDVLDKAITVSPNAQFSYGTTDTGYAAQQLVNAGKAGLTTTGVTSVLAVKTPLQVSSGGIGVGTGATAADNTAAIGSDALLVVDASAAKVVDGGSQGAIKATTATVNSGAKLFVPGAKVGEDYVIFTDGTDAKGDLNDFDEIKTDSKLVVLTPDATDTGKLGGSVADVAGAFPTLDSQLVNALKAAAEAGQIPAVNSEDKGVRFLSRATSESYIGGDADLAAQTIEGAARMVTIGAVPQMTRTANQAAAEAVTQRTSMAIPSSIQTQQATDRVALWIMPLYQSTNGARLEAGNMDADYHGGLGGIALGADYTFANAIRAGIAFNIGAGYATGGGDFADTTNNMNFWGLGAYAGWTGNNIGVSADVNFTSAYNKLTQDLPQSMGMRDLKADVRSYAFSTGLRGEYKLETSAVDITPHVGVRFMYLTTDDYKVKSEGTVLKGDGLHQNIWTFPIGVSFSKNIERSNGWHVKPMLDLAVVPAAGDIKAKENVRFSGTDYKAELETQVMDYITYQGVLGLEVGNQNLTFGLSGNTQFGEKTSGYGVLGSFRYEF